MSKPLGISLGIGGDGMPRMSAYTPTRTEDMIWEAVREAICANWTPKQFHAEVSQAWTQALKDDIRAAQNEFSK